MNLKKFYCGAFGLHRAGRFIGINSDTKKEVWCCDHCGSYYEVVGSGIKYESCSINNQNEVVVRTNGKLLFPEYVDHYTHPVDYKQLILLMNIHMKRLHIENLGKENALDNLTSELSLANSEISLLKEILKVYELPKGKYSEIYKAMNDIYLSALKVDISSLVGIESGKVIELPSEVGLFVNQAIKKAKNRFWLYDRLKWSDSKKGKLVYKKRDRKK